MSDGIRRTIHVDHNTQSIVYEQKQDVEAILDNNKQLQSETQKSDWGRHIASIPNVIMAQWIHEDGVNYLGMPARAFEQAIMRKLRDPQWAYLRTGKL